MKTKRNIGHKIIFPAFLIFTVQASYFLGGNARYLPMVIPATGISWPTLNKSILISVNLSKSTFVELIHGMIVNNKLTIMNVL